MLYCYRGNTTIYTRASGVSMARRKKAKIDVSKLTLDELAALPGQYDLRMYDIKTNLWSPPEKRLVTGNPDSGLAWIESCEAAGYVTLDDAQEQQNLVRAVLKKNANGGGDYDPASVANKPSGYGVKPSRKPTRDYKGPALGPSGYAPVRVRMGRDFGPAKD